MKKKQVKIMGFQAENCKLKLFYETDGVNYRYIVEYNRKYVHNTRYYEEAKKYFKSTIINYMNIMKLEL